MWAVKLCSNKILQFLAGWQVELSNDHITIVVAGAVAVRCLTIDTVGLGSAGADASLISRHLVVAILVSYGRPGIGHAIIFLFCGFFLSSSCFFFPRLISAATDWMSTIVPHMNLECRSEVCCSPVITAVSSERAMIDTVHSSLQLQTRQL